MQEQHGPLQGYRERHQRLPLLWNLMSYYYLRNDVEFAVAVRDMSDLVMIDSGAHSFQKGTKVKWDEYTHAYAAFIREFDRPNVVGYFEMDVDNVIGYPKVLELRSILERESGHPEKIIPVWHKNRGIKDFKDMCASHAGRVIAITGFKNEDIRDEQYTMFLKEAKRHGCRVHCLGMTRKAVLDRVPFDPSTGEQAEFGMVLLPGLLIVAGSVCGQFIGENIDGRIFHKVWKGGEGSHVKAALCSNVVSIPIDTVIMCCIAFGLTVPLDTLAATIGANIAIKYVVMLASVAVYAAASRR